MSLSISDTETFSNVELQKADIVFLMDASDQSQANGRLVLDFIKEFVKRIEIGTSNVQVALIQYSTEPEPEFLLNTYSLKDPIMSHISNVNLKGDFVLNTGLALQYVKNNVLVASSGSRALQGVPQIVILFSGRQSDDDVLSPVEELTNSGISLFKVGVNKSDGVETGEEYIMKDKSDFPLLETNLISAITSHRGPISPGVGE